MRIEDLQADSEFSTKYLEPDAKPTEKEPLTEMADITVKVLENGPLLVTGDIEVVDSDGANFKWEGTAAALCRCGGSGNKPFCDGTHTSIEFKDATRAD